MGACERVLSDDRRRRSVGWRERGIGLEERKQMNATRVARVLTQPRTDLRLCAEPASEESATYWWINGYRARLLVWTQDEWANLETRPTDAQLHPAGVWCALRMD